MSCQRYRRGGTVPRSCVSVEWSWGSLGTEGDHVTDADLAWKRQQIAYYDEEARRGYADKHYGDAVGTGYRANYFRVQKVLALLHAHPGTKKVLDVGCGDGWPLLCMLRDRFDAEGFDLSRPMLEAAEKRLTANKYEA